MYSILMSLYTFRLYSNPIQLVSDSRADSVPYEIAFGQHAIVQWGGVMPLPIASSLKPWAKAVRIPFTAYRVGVGEWCELAPEEAIWGCLLKASGYREHAVFALVDAGLPVVSRKKKRERFINRVGEQNLSAHANRCVEAWTFASNYIF